MQAVVKMHHTEGNAPGIILRFRPRTPARIIKHIEREYRNFLVDPDDELVVWEETRLAGEIDARMTPGKYLRNLREAQGMTQQDVADKTGHRPAYISDMENDRRAISRMTARRLAEMFNTSPALFI